MIHPKENSTFCFSESVVVGIAPPKRSSTPPSSAPTTTDDDVLQDLFRARLEGPVRLERCTNERPRRTTPFMNMLSGPSLFENKQWNSNSLFHQLGQQKPLKAVASSNNNNANKTTNNTNNNDNGPFPWHSALFATTSPLPTSSSSSSSSSTTTSTPNNTRPMMMTGDSQLDERIRSFSASLRLNDSNPSHHQLRRAHVGHHNKKRPRNQATRYRLVGQVLGQKGVQKVVATVKEIKQLQQALHPATADAAAVKNLLTDTVLVDAWENTPVEDLKTLPWEEMLQTSQNHLESYKAWQKESSS